MPKEVASIISLLCDVRKTEMAGRTFYEGRYENKDIVACVAGIGKVNASVTTTLVCEHFKPQMIINVGVAGGASKVLKALDIVVALKVGYHDVDLTADSSDFAIGQLPYMPRFFETDSDAVKILSTFSMKNRNVHFGTILTGDQFVIDPAFLENVILKHFQEHDVLAVDMESSSIAQVCHIYKLPFIVIRSISDVIGSTNQSKEYYDFLSEACLNATEVTKHLLNHLS
jgi:adenosylhomocysteine nucleosidase